MGDGDPCVHNLLRYCASMSPCSVPDCPHPHKAKGLCDTHYKRWRRIGTTEEQERPRTPVADRVWPRVVKTETCWLWTGGTQHGYGSVGAPPGVKPRSIRVHRWVYETLVGPIPPGSSVDHSCRVTRCVNPAHLRLATPKQNSENVARVTKRGLPRGVSFHKGSGKYHARVTHNRRTYFVGEFASPVEAGEAARAKRIELFTHNDDDR